MPDNLLLLLLAALINSAAFLFQRITGFGSAIAATPLLALFWDPHYAINLLLIYQFIFGAVLIGRTWRRLLDPRLRWFLIAFVPAVVLGAFLLPVLSAEMVRFLLAIVTIIVLLQWLFVPQFVIAERFMHPVGFFLGLCSGIVSGAFGMGGPFMIAYYGNVEKRSGILRDAIIAVFAATNALRLPIAASTAQLSPPVLWAAALSLIPFILAMWWGSKLSEKMDDKLFRYALISILAVAAVNLLFR